MTYNIEIFKSGSYQKILKAVLKFRYPDLSYEEALIKETDYKNCLHYASNPVCMRVEMCGLEFINPNTIILGRPITICELINVLNSLLDEEEYPEEYGYYFQLDSIYKMDYFIGYNNVRQFLPQLIVTLKDKTYFLHEQTQETIDKIAKLLD